MVLSAGFAWRRRSVLEFGTQLLVEVLAVVQTAMLAGLPYTGLRDAILTHPTMAEGLNVLLASVPPDTNARLAARALARWEGEGGRVHTQTNREA
jgi:hypothetical protein